MGLLGFGTAFVFAPMVVPTVGFGLTLLIMRFPAGPAVGEPVVIPAQPSADSVSR